MYTLPQKKRNSILNKIEQMLRRDGSRAKGAKPLKHRTPDTVCLIFWLTIGWYTVPAEESLSLILGLFGFDGVETELKLGLIILAITYKNAI